MWSARKCVSRAWRRAVLLLLWAATASLPFTGCGTEKPRCRLVPESLDFGPVVLGEHSEKTLQVVNDGETSLDLALSLIDTDFDLLGGDTISVMLTPGDSAAVTVRFAPKGAGARAARVEIRGGPCGGIECRGLGESPECHVEPLALDFGRVLVGASTQRSFLVKSTGPVPLHCEVLLACSEFSVVAGGGSFSLASGDSLLVTVVLTPLSVGAKACSVSLGTGLCLGVECTGEGTRTWAVFADGSGDALTIQAAIDSSRDGDQVLVHPGTYHENLNLRGKAIHLKSAAGPEVTIIDGSREDNTVIFCGSWESNDTIIEGFTITGGRGWTPPWSIHTKLGGGIHCQVAAPTIRGNIIRGNRAVDTPPGGNSRGGAISFGAPGLPPIVIEGNVIQDNYCSRNGGGINVEHACLIQDNVIRENVAGLPNEGDGGGIYVLFADWPIVIRRNAIVENHAGDHGGGIYMANEPGDMIPEVHENLILRNTSRTIIANDCSGGGIWLSGEAHIHHNTIAFNRATNVAVVPAAGGCCIWETHGEPIIEYNVVYKNFGGGIIAWKNTTGSIRVNIVFGNDPEIYNHPGNTVVIEDVLLVDPLFCDTTSSSTGEIAAESPALSWSAGVIGAVDHASCSMSRARAVPGGEKP